MCPDQPSYSHSGINAARRSVVQPRGFTQVWSNLCWQDSVEDHVAERQNLLVDMSDFSSGNAQDGN